MTGLELDNSNRLPSPKVLPCPRCSIEIKIYAHAQSNHIACSCGRVFRYTNNELKDPKKFEDYNIENLIPIGRQGVLGGVIYQMVGFLHCKEQGTHYYWKEYILFNPIYGYATLSEFSGHWNLVKPTLSFPRLKAYPKSFEEGDNTYKIFNKYRAEVQIGLGEFTSNIMKRHRSTVYEFISPPNILIREISADEEVWFKGEYIEPSIIWSAFKLKSRPPGKTGVGATQVLKYSADLNLLKIATFFAVVLLLGFQLLMEKLSDEKEVFNNSYSLPDSTVVSPIVTPSFQLNGGISNLEFSLYSNVDNEWFEAQISLINDQTDEEYGFEDGVEYYSGYEDGYAWSEGDHNSHKILSSIPDGRYHLNIFPYKPYTPGGLYFTLTLKRDVPMWSNFFWFLGLILIYPLIQWIRISTFESSRWMGSDFSPG